MKTKNLEGSYLEAFLPEETNKEIWREIIRLGRKNEGSYKTEQFANHLSDEQIETIITQMQFFDATEGTMNLALLDLKNFKYKVYDWLAMCVGGRMDAEKNEKTLKILVYAYLKAKGDVDKFVKFLWKEDYNKNRDWEKIPILNSQVNKKQEEK